MYENFRKYMPPISVTISKVDPKTHKIIQSITREVTDAESIGFNFLCRRISASSYGHIHGGSVEIDFARFTTDRNERLSVGFIKLRDEYFWSLLITRWKRELRAYQLVRKQNNVPQVK